MYHTHTRIVIKHSFAKQGFFYSFTFARSLPNAASMVYILAPTLSVSSTGSGAGRGCGGLPSVGWCGCGALTVATAVAVSCGCSSDGGLNSGRGNDGGSC